MLKKEFSHSTPKTEGPHVPDVSHIKNPDVLHEESDVNTGPIYKFGFWMIVIIVGTGVLMWLLWEMLEKREIAQDPPAAVMQRPAGDRLPPEPRLQLAPGHEVHPLDEMAEMHVQQKQMLASYGWVDKSNNTVRIPIAEAKKLFLQRGVSVAPQGTADTTGVSSSPAAMSTEPAMSKYGRAVPSGQSGGRSNEWHR
jgi:hypothetical protein